LRQGKLIVFEGPDGIGKSHLADETFGWLQGLGVEALQVSFPGSAENTLGRLVYDLHHYHTDRFHIPAINPLSLQVLHIAAHIDEIGRVVRPAIERGTWVILNRFWWSTWVYGMLDSVDQKCLELIIEVEKCCWSDLLPSAIFLVRRQEAIRREHAQDTFDRLSFLYSELFTREQPSGVIHDVDNSELGASLESITTVLKGILEQ
jgi:thymidylate kinase